MTLSPDLVIILDKARRYMDSAETLRRRGDYDSAASRLYYAMFYCASALLRAEGLTFTSHKGVLSSFARHFVKPKLLPQELHRWLREAFDARQISDYQFETSVSEAEILDLEGKAQRFLSAAEAFLKQQVGEAYPP